MMFSLKNVCNTIVVDKRTTTKNTDKSSSFSQRMRYSKYINLNSRNYYKVTETEITSLTVSDITPTSAMVTYTYYSKPAFVELIVTNIQKMTDTQTFMVYDIPFKITRLSPNSYYTIKTYTVFTSGDRFMKTFENAIFTLLEGPPLEIISITNPQFTSATLNFRLPIGDVTSFSVNLNVIQNNNKSITYFFPDITSPFIITGLETDVIYDISLSSFYPSTQNSYSVYKSNFSLHIMKIIRNLKV